VIHLWQRDGEYHPVALTSENSDSHYREVEKHLAS